MRTVRARLGSISLRLSTSSPDSRSSVSSFMISSWKPAIHSGDWPATASPTPPNIMIIYFIALLQPSPPWTLGPLVGADPAVLDIPISVFRTCVARGGRRERVGSGVVAAPGGAEPAEEVRPAD